MQVNREGGAMLVMVLFMTFFVSVTVIFIMQFYINQSHQDTIESERLQARYYAEGVIEAIYHQFEDSFNLDKSGGGPGAGGISRNPKAPNPSKIHLRDLTDLDINVIERVVINQIDWNNYFPNVDSSEIEIEDFAVNNAVDQAIFANDVPDWIDGIKNIDLEISVQHDGRHQIEKKVRRITNFADMNYPFEFTVFAHGVVRADDEDNINLATDATLVDDVDIRLLIKEFNDQRMRSVSMADNLYREWNPVRVHEDPNIDENIGTVGTEDYIITGIGYPTSATPAGTEFRSINGGRDVLDDDGNLVWRDFRADYPMADPGLRISDYNDMGFDHFNPGNDVCAERSINYHNYIRDIGYYSRTLSGGLDDLEDIDDESGDSFDEPLVELVGGSRVRAVDKLIDLEYYLVVAYDRVIIHGHPDEHTVANMMNSFIYAGEGVEFREIQEINLSGHIISGGDIDFGGAQVINIADGNINYEFLPGFTTTKREDLFWRSSEY